MKLIQSGNTKLPGMKMFNLPAGHLTCNRICHKCYANKEQVRFPSILAARTARFEASKSSNFSDTIINELRSLRKLPKHFRIHASGDFYSQQYIDSWVTITKTFPSVIFYAYTKRLAHFDFSQLSALPNFILINSLHFGGLNYGPTSSAPTNAFICPSSKGAICGTTCTYCQTKSAQSNSVYFPIH